MHGARPTLIEFPADDPERALSFWAGVLDAPLEPRTEGQGEGWQTGASAPPPPFCGPGPGDRVSLPYFTVADVAAALERVVELGGDVVHPGEQWAICRDSEGSPFALARG